MTNDCRVFERRVNYTDEEATPPSD